MGFNFHEFQLMMNGWVEMGSTAGWSSFLIIYDSLSKIVGGATIARARESDKNE